MENWKLRSRCAPRLAKYNSTDSSRTAPPGITGKYRMDANPLSAAPARWMLNDGTQCFRFLRRIAARTFLRAEMCSGKIRSSSSPGEPQPADEPRDQPGGEHRGENQKQQIIRGKKGADPDRAEHHRIDQPGARDALAQSRGPGFDDSRPPFAEGSPHVSRLSVTRSKKNGHRFTPIDADNSILFSDLR